MTLSLIILSMAQALVPSAPPPPTADTQLILLGENAGGRQILVDPTSLKIMPPLVGMRSFPTTQLFVEMRGPGTKGSVERVRYSFNCRARSSAALHYFRSVSGRKSHDWRGADVSFRYQPVASGTLVGMAMTYACSGGKLPVRPPNPAAVPDSEPKDDDGA